MHHVPPSSMSVLAVASCIVSRNLVRFSGVLSSSAFAASTRNMMKSPDQAHFKPPQEKKLFTPGPLGVTRSVKEAMLRDLGSRDTEFVNTVDFIRSKLLQIAAVTDVEYAAIPMQGSGTFAVESVFHTTVKRNSDKVLIFEGGAYGRRLGRICKQLGINHKVVSNCENEAISLSAASAAVAADSYTHVAAVHCETSSGVVNPIESLGRIVRQALPESTFIVDAMSSFGAIPLDLRVGHVDYLISSANKCLQGVPGFAFVISRTSSLAGCKGNSSSLSLDLHDQYESLEKTKQFRFTPPTHVMLAFKQALCEFEEEGGISGRAARYQANKKAVTNGMAKLGFKEFLDPADSGYIITSYKYPSDKRFDFQTFYNKLNEKGQVIYPGKVLDADCFRIGTIGQLYPADMEHLVQSIEEVLKEMAIDIPVQ